MQVTTSITVKITTERGLSQHKEKQTEKEEKCALPLCYLRYSNPTVTGTIFFCGSFSIHFDVLSHAKILMKT